MQPLRRLLEPAPEAEMLPVLRTHQEDARRLDEQRSQIAAAALGNPTQTVDWSSPKAKDIFYAQEPGKDNPLVFMKINFFNSHAVLMHDTPLKTLFSRNYRAESSGCIRIQNISRLAAWLLEDSGWDQRRVLSMRQSRETLNVPVKGDVKLYFAYVTAWATLDGTTHFRRDIYKRDGVGVTATAY